MPKIKTKAGVKKRFRTNGSGKVKFKPAHKRHLLMNKSRSRKRKSRGAEIMKECDAGLVRTFMPYARRYKNESAMRNAKKREGE